VCEGRSMGRWPLEIMLVTFARGKRRPIAVVMNGQCAGARHAFHASAQSGSRPVYLDDLDLFQQTEGGLAVMQAIRRSILSGKQAVSDKEMIETVAAIEAGRRAHNKARAVPLKRVR